MSAKRQRQLQRRRQKLANRLSKPSISLEPPIEQVILSESVELTLRLVRMSQQCLPPRESNNRIVFSREEGGGRAEARAIGRRLWEIGGTPLMRSALSAVQRQDQRALDVAWDGIGEGYDVWLG